MDGRAATPDSLSRPRERARVRARSLRGASTDAERALWHELRDRRLAGCKFRRQHPIGPYLADFACLEAKLVIELDGGQHFEPPQAEADARRTAALAALGYTVLRFSNRQVLLERAAVLQSLHDRLAAGRLHDHPHPDPLPPAGEGESDQP